MTMDNSEKVLNTSSPFTLHESEVSRTTGLSLEEVQKNRKTAPEWAAKIGRAWLWSEAGLMGLETAYGKNAAAPEAPTLPVVASMMVARVRTPRVLHIVPPGQQYNPRAPLACVLPQPFGMFFVAGMPVAAKRRPGTDNVWDYAGNPDKPGSVRSKPRRVGMW